jgi:hypothetical protein
MPAILALLLPAARWLVTSWLGRALLAVLTLLCFAAWERHQGATHAVTDLRASEVRQLEKATHAGNAAAAAAGSDDPVDRLRRGDW